MAEYCSWWNRDNIRNDENDRRDLTRYRHKTILAKHIVDNCNKTRLAEVAGHALTTAMGIVAHVWIRNNSDHQYKILYVM